MNEFMYIYGSPKTDEWKNYPKSTNINVQMVLIHILGGAKKPAGMYHEPAGEYIVYPIIFILSKMGVGEKDS